MKPFWTNPKNFDDCRRIFVDIGLRLRTAPLNNLSATAAPTATDDRRKGYSVGSLWKYATTGQVSVMTKDSDDNATWIDQPTTDHNLLDGSVHVDTAADAVTRGSLIYGNSTPKWDELVKGSDGQYLGSDGTDVAWQGLNLVDDTTPEFGGDVALAATGVDARSFFFDHEIPALLTIENLGGDNADLLVKGSIQADISLLVSGFTTLVNNVTVGDGTAENRTITFNSLANDGVITWDQDPGQFLFSHAIDVNGNIIVSGTVDGRDVQTDGTKLDGIESGAKVGDVVGPGTIVDNAMVRFDTTSGKLVQSTGIIVDDSDEVTGMTKLTVDDVVINAQLIEARLSSQSIAIQGGSDAGKVVTVGRAGDTTLGDGTLRVMYPQTDEKIDLGKATNRFNDVHAVSFIPKSRVAWTLIGSEALDRTVDWGATYTNDQLRDILLSVIKDSIAEGRF